MTDPLIPADVRRWVADALTPMNVREALAKAPWYRGQAATDRYGDFAQPFFYRCRHFDAETRTCTDYDNRPELCSGYPWYDVGPNEWASIPPDCSFREDLLQIGPKP